ncbi:hypothetical protein BRC94_05010 [Halobacteriales archaeon QS_5_70_17]|nr:MAG: hypothetical protein BRC94_05010 [Halobacteriales archaeon QS_5_70_17]
MPLDTDAEAWINADAASTHRDEVLAYLREYSGSAFHARELADAVMGTDWAGRAEAAARGDGATVDHVHTMYLHDQLNELVREGEVVARNVPTARIDDRAIPSGWDYVTYFAYGGG